MDGWIKLYRKIRNHWIWQDQRYFQWWVDILLMVGHREYRQSGSGKNVKLGVGECFVTENFLSQRWHTSRDIVRHFLFTLESDNMITTKRTTKGTTVKVLNYKAYQGKKEGKKNSETHNENHNFSRSESHNDIHSENHSDFHSDTNNAPYYNKKKEFILVHFDQFWSCYPNKKAKADAQKAWAKLNPDAELLEVILRAVERGKSDPQWTRDGGQYIPLPASWIRGRRWEDEAPELTVEDEDDKYWTEGFLE